MRLTHLRATPQSLWMGPESYTDEAKAWLARSGHYLDNPPPGCLFAVAVREGMPGLFGETVQTGPRLGLCVVGRPVARELPQDGSVGEVTRFVLSPGLPHGTASRLLLAAADQARVRRMVALIAYHDRTRHTGCIYKKAGFRKDGSVKLRAVGWGNRAGRKSAEYGPAPKRRWRLALAPIRRAEE